MDYCYTPFPPEPPTTTTTTEATAAAEATAASAEEAMAAMSQYSAPSFPVKELEFAGECSAASPCGVCQGDCDSHSQCAKGLECFDRPKGSTEPVPGCRGAGRASMDYCHDPNAPIVPPGPAPLPECSDEVTCPDGTVVRQDRNDNCRFPPCPTPAPTTPSPTPSPTGSPTLEFDRSTYYCGYSVNNANANCATARPCSSDGDCVNMMKCFGGTRSADYVATTTVATTTTTAPPEE